MLLAAFPAAAQIVPTDTDLKAAFCVGVLRELSPIDTTTATTPEIDRVVAELNAKKLAVLQHIRAYLLPRRRFIDLDSITSAMDEGGRAKQQSLARFLECASDPAWAAALKANDPKAMTRARENCEGTIGIRTRACFDLSFLPF